MRKHPFLLIIFLLASTLSAQETIYKTVLMRAAPGKLLQLIDLIKTDMEKHAEYGLAKPYLIRHSQGDQWDLLLIVPIGSMEDHYRHDTVEKRKSSFVFAPQYGGPFYNYIAHYEDLFAAGPAPDLFAEKFEAFKYFHVEMFISLPGKQTELLKQRQMENVYLKEIGRDPNLIFTRVAGSKWDIFTIGYYRDIKHFAESADIPPEVEEQAALKAGFKGANFIGSYLRELIRQHHDTLAGKIDSR